jgi:hypothetical protein
MRRERKIEQKQERFLAKQEERRQRKMSSKDSLPRPYHLGANAAAVDGERNIEGMKETAAAVENAEVAALAGPRNGQRPRSNRLAFAGIRDAASGINPGRR